MTATVARFVRDSSGATMVEYAIIASLVSVAMAFAATSIGTQLNGALAAVADHFN
jgi:Flp pilus assembly pilin Flp